ncbi:MAG: RagB/SusD family nutrient uptake outer membrane protein [Gemmatimonadetes bacterium]|nr:RagB/SusD family nutrient uptake outer membrane protein [Gemmatimonadota bacterium]
MRPIRTLGYLVALGGLLTTGCSTLDVPNLNDNTLDGLTGAPTASAVATATQGLVRGMRGNASSTLSIFGRLGREGYILDPGNPQNTPALYVVLGNIGIWAGPYSNIKLANVVLEAVDKVATLSTAEKEGIKGFAKTVKAIELMNVINSMDQNGAALDVTAGPTDPLPPIATKAEVWARILQLFDEGRTHLLAAGTKFAFDPGDGLASFNTPAGMVKVNRAMKARADVLTSSYAAALTDLTGSFLDVTQPLTLGVYNTFSTASGDAINQTFYDPTARQVFARPWLATNAQSKANGDLDDRFTSKVFPVTPSFQRQGFLVSWTFRIYNSPSAPIPLIRNEELILLRAEANLGLGNTSTAIQDINFIRAQAGGLPAISDPYVPVGNQPATLLDELLYEKRYSLLWEIGTTWLDARHYGKLAQLPKEITGEVVFPYTRIPDAECDARSPKPAGCTSPAGL